jgi:hypothetical protein
MTKVRLITEVSKKILEINDCGIDATIDVTASNGKRVAQFGNSDLDLDIIRTNMVMSLIDVKGDFDYEITHKNSQ